MGRISRLRVAPVSGAGELSGIVDDCLIVLPAALPGGERREYALYIEYTLTLIIPWRLAQHAGRGIAASLRLQRRRLFIRVTNPTGLYTLSAEEASTSSSASRSIGGNSLPRRFALRRMPSQARLLK